MNESFVCVKFVIFRQKNYFDFSATKNHLRTYDYNLERLNIYVSFFFSWKLNCKINI